MQNYYNRISDLRNELTAEIVEYLKGLKHKFIIIPDEDRFEEGVYLMWVDDDGYAHDGRVKKVSLYNKNGFSVDVEDNGGDSTTLHSGIDVGCNHVDWLADLLFMLKTFIDGENWRYCHECGIAMDEGFVIDLGTAYYCTDECLFKNYTPEQWKKMWEGPEGNIQAGNDHNYWTVWWDI